MNLSESGKREAFQVGDAKDWVPVFMQSRCNRDNFLVLNYSICFRR